MHAALDSASIVFYVVAAAAWFAALVGPARWWRRGRPGAGMMFAVLVILGFCFLGLTNVVTTWIGHLVPGEANAGVLVRDGLGMALAWSVQMLMLTAAYKPDERAAAARWRTMSLSAVLVAMTIAFLIEFTGKPFALDYATRWGHDPVFLLYCALYDGFFLIALWDIQALTVRAVRIAARPSVRVGLRLINAAAWFALVFVLTVLIKLAIDQVRPGVYFALGLISEYSCITAGFLLIAGMLTPVAGIGVETAIHAPQRRRLLGRLGPLARILDVAGDIPWFPTQERVTAHLVELRDAARELLPWCMVAGPDADEQEVARLLAAAAEARRDGVTPQRRGWMLPVWFAEPERVALVADTLGSGTTVMVQ